MGKNFSGTLALDLGNTNTVIAFQGEKDKDSIYAFLEDKIAKWWKPDDIVFVEELPIGATGKVLKIELREKFKDHLMK